MTTPAFYSGTGRRKTAIARVRLLPGEGEIVVNGRSLDEHFGNAVNEADVRMPFRVTDTEGRFNAMIKVEGGGVTGQAGAIRHGIARALLEVDADGQPRAAAPGRPPDARPAHEGTQEVRPQARPQGPSVHQALTRRRRPARHARRCSVLAASLAHAPSAVRSLAVLAASPCGPDRAGSALALAVLARIGTALAVTTSRRAPCHRRVRGTARSRDHARADGGTLRGRDLLSRRRTCRAAEVERVFATARRSRRSSGRRGGTPAPPLVGRTLAMLFQKPSLRTRVTFEAGMAQLGGTAIYLPEDTVMGAREAVRDVAHNLERFVDGIVARTGPHEVVVELAAQASIPVINGLTLREHPCQALADVFTIREHLGSLRGRGRDLRR